jgi:hypothetical protein
MPSILDILKMQPTNPYGATSPAPTMPNKLGEAIQNRWTEINTPRPVKPMTQQEAIDAALGIAPLGMIAYHGTQYKFDKFDPAKIGTGEGAQAYGHGLYFAENPNVAMSYKDKLSSGVMLNDKFIDNKMILEAKNKTTASVLKKLKDAGEVSNSPFSDVMSNATKNELNVLKQLKPNLKTGNQTGSLYKVDIADETIPKMLQWDKPISEQSKEVQKAIAPIVKSYGLPYNESGASVYQATKELLGQEKKLINKRDALFNKYQKEGMSLSDTVRSMSPEDRNAFSSIATKIANLKDTPQMASNYLQKRGVTGIKYLDEGSRDVGQGTSNYVVFDPNTIKILERNGLLFK